MNKKDSLPKKIATGIFGSIEKSGKIVGNVLDFVSESDLYKYLSEKLGIYWFFDKILSVDTFKVRKQVEKFREKYPEETNDKLAERLTRHKAFYTATIGFTSGLIPGNVPAIIFDFIASTAAQAELIYEIAMVYGLDLDDSTRKGEVLTLIALGAGSTKTAEASLKLALEISSKKMGQYMTEKMLKAFSVVVGEKIAKRSLSKLIPVVGGLIGASINASIIMLTGKGAIAFYENLSKHNLIFSGDLPDELKNIYNKIEIKEDVEISLRDLIIIKTIIYLLHEGNFTEEVIQNIIYQNFPAYANDQELQQIIQQEVQTSTYTDLLTEKIDRATASIIITRAIMCITSIGPINEKQKTYLKTLANKFDLPFEDFKLDD